MDIFLVRHGTTKWNADHRIQGRSDIPLDELGREMARCSGMKIISDGIVFDRVFSSPLLRALETAELVGSFSSDEILVDDRLAELSFGAFEGRIVEEMTADPDCAFKYFKTAPDVYDARVRELQVSEPDGNYESLGELVARASLFMKEVVEPCFVESPDCRVLISGHGALNKALLMYISGIDDLKKFWGGGLQANCGVCRIRYDQNGYRIVDDNLIFYDPELAARITGLL